jgi:hypothetical protein
VVRRSTLPGFTRLEIAQVQRFFDANQAAALPIDNIKYSKNS